MDEEDVVELIKIFDKNGHKIDFGSFYRVLTNQLDKLS